MSGDAVLEAPPLSCFKAYDIRGRVGRDLDEDAAYRIGRAVAEVFSPQSVVMGRDCRVSGQALSGAFTDGLTAAGVHVFDIGVAGTEEVYHAVSHLFADVGAVITASHNPAHDNGIKFIAAAGRPVTAEEFAQVRVCADRMSPQRLRGSGRRIAVNTRAAYVERLLQCVDLDVLSDVQVVCNAGNGVAGPAFDALCEALGNLGVQVEAVRLNHSPDGRFPKGVPNPMIGARREETAQAVRDSGAAFGIAWDGDFDRCFLFDGTGAFIDGAHLAALLAEHLGDRDEVVLHDHRVIWPSTSAAKRAGALAKVARTGHVHMKHAMRQTGAIYGGEMSGHHYFREFMSCDTGMLPWLKTLEVMGRHRAPLAEIVAPIVESHPVSGEMNFRAPAPDRVLDAVEARYSSAEAEFDQFDGLSMTFPDWRCNLRSSSTEPLLRLNIETRADPALLEESRAQLTRLLIEDLGCEAQP